MRPITRRILRLTGVRPGEAKVVLLGSLYFFFVLSAYYVIRPVREEMGVRDIDNIPWLYTGTAIAMLVVHSLFGWVSSRWSRRRLAQITYQWFALNLLVFFALLSLWDGLSAAWVQRAFFIWVSVFNLCAVAVFWSYMTDVYSPDQGRRLFAITAVGGTLGAILGSSIPAFFASFVGTVNLLLISVVFLQAALACVLGLERWAQAKDSFSSSRPAKATRAGIEPGKAASARAGLGGGFLDGARQVLLSPYLLGIALFMLCRSAGATFLYNIQLELVGEAFPGNEAQVQDARTAFFSQINLAVNILTLLVQLFLTGRLLRWLGVGVTLALLPLICVVGFGALAAAPVLSVFVVLYVLSRSAEFAVASPTRSVLYQVLDRSRKYKARNFNDTLCYRSGDALFAWIYRSLKDAFAPPMGLIALAAVPLSAAWLALSVWLGRERRNIKNRTPASGGARRRLPSRA